MVDKMTPGQSDLGGQARTLVTDGILGDLNKNRIARFERLLDLAAVHVRETRLGGGAVA